MKRQGRPKTEFSDEMRLEAEQVIYKYRHEVKPRGVISINSIVKYSNHLYKEGSIKHNFKEHFWKNSYGRNLIEKSNRIISTVLSDEEFSERDTIVDTVDAVEKLFKPNKPSYKSKLINSLKRNETNLALSMKENDRKDKKIEELTSELEGVKQENKELGSAVNELESMFFAWLDASSNKNNNLKNMVTTGRTRTNIVDEFFHLAFENPVEALESFLDGKYDKDEEDSKNVLPLQKGDKKSMFDDMEF